MCSVEARAGAATYVELHAHSAFSFLDGASQPEELAAAAAELGYTHLALTDHDNLAGALEFAHAAKHFGIVPITGAEVTVCDDLQRVAHVTLLARTREGYRNLCRLLTLAYAPRGLAAVAASAGDVADAWTASAQAWQEAEQRLGARVVRETSSGERARTRDRYSRVPAGRIAAPGMRVRGSAERPDPLVSLEQLCAHAEGLVCLTGCASKGLLLADLATSRPTRAVELVHELQRRFGEQHVYVELQLPQQRGDVARNRALRQVAELAHAPVVATGNVHAHTVARGRLHEVLVAIRHNTTLEACEGERAGNLALVMRSPLEMQRRFVDHADAVANTRRIAESIEFDLTCDLGYEYPSFSEQHGMTPDELLAHVCHAEFDRRYAGRVSATRARPRLEEELAIVRHHGLSGFFLLHRDVLELAREVAHDIRGPGSARAANPPGRGRGSSVESIICYLTGLSHVDPIETGLKLGRFLNEELPSMPDIDLDFPRDIRHELLRRVVDRYGSDHSAMVAAHATYRARGAIRDVGRALGLSPAELTRIAKRTDAYNARYVADAVDQQGPRWQAFKALTFEIADLPRVIGQHSGGVIVSTSPLNGLVPIQPTAMHGRQICQWDKDSCADAGFLKIDVLGLGMLSSVEECVETIATSSPAVGGGDYVDLSRIDYADQAVFDEIQAGDTVGTFQIESRAQMQSIKRVKPEDLHDLAIQVALIRPGPIIGKSVNPYVALREARRVDPSVQPTYDHPLLEPVLKDTYGAIIFQDQVIEVAMALSGFSAGDADGLRRAMSRKRAAGSVEVYRERFMAGAARRGVDDATATLVFDKLIGFCHYGFPRAHSVAFALLAYQSAWLRHHYPAHFTVSLLNAQPMGFYPPDSLLRDAARHGVSAHPVDVNVSDALCTVEEAAGPGSDHAVARSATADGVAAGVRPAIRIGLGYVKGVGFTEGLQLQRERERGGVFGGIDDLARRTAGFLRGDQLEHLVIAGATDSFGEPRREQLWRLGLVARGNASQPALEVVPPDSPEFAQLSMWEEIAADFRSQGLSVRGHPVQVLRGLLPAQVVPIDQLETTRHRATVEVVGAVVARQKPATAKGTVFMLIEDETGTANVIVNAQLYRQQRLVVRGEPLVRVRGRLERHGDVINLVAQGIWKLPRELRDRTPTTSTARNFH